MSLQFAKQEFKLKKIERPIDMRNINGTFNKKRQIKHTMEVNTFLQRAQGENRDQCNQRIKMK